MSNEPAPFTFQKARPARKTTQEEPAAINDSPGLIETIAGSAPKRKRRTRAEMAEAGGLGGPHWVQEEMTALKVCLKQLRSLDGQARTRILALLKAVFE